jgi:hypothetical protein
MESLADDLPMNKAKVILNKVDDFEDNFNKVITKIINAFNANGENDASLLDKEKSYVLYKSIKYMMFKLGLLSHDQKPILRMLQYGMSISTITQFKDLKKKPPIVFIMI